MSIPTFNGLSIPVITIPPDEREPVELLTRHQTNISEAIDTTEERQDLAPRPLYGLKYESLTLSSQETGYLRRVLDLAKDQPVAVPLWPLAAKLTAGVSAGATSLPTDDTTDCLFGVHASYALLWESFTLWEVVELNAVGATTTSLLAALANAYTVKARLLPLAYGNLARSSLTGVTDANSRWHCEFEEVFHGLFPQATPEDSPPGLAEPELSEWLARVAIAGGTVPALTIGYVATFIIAIKTAGVRVKLKRCGIYCGDFAALKAPLFNTWGSTEDSIGANFLPGDYSESTGLANAALRNAFINTGLNPVSVGVDANDWHMACYVRTPASDTTALMGGQATGAATASTYLLVSYSGVSYFEAWAAANQISFSDSMGIGFYIGTRNAAAQITLYKNGAAQAASSVTGGTIAANTIGVHTYLNGGSNAAPTDRAISFYSMGLKLTGADALALYTAVQTLQTSLARNV